MTHRNNIVVVSNDGTCLQTLIDASIFNSKITLVVSQHSDSIASVFARKHRIPLHIAVIENETIELIEKTLPSIVIDELKLVPKLTCPILKMLYYNESSVSICCDNKEIVIESEPRQKLILEAVCKVLRVHNNTVELGHTNFNLLAINYSNCQEGYELVAINEFWFKQTRHIIKNYFIYAKDNVLIAHKTRKIPIEFIVRGYITGDLWEKYSSGNRRYYGIEFDDNLVNNQRLPQFIITPVAIDGSVLTREEIEQNYLTLEQTNHIYESAIKLFRYGQSVSRGRGLILVETKYEFGINTKDEIILIGEIHTCDSSKYWVEKYYEKAFVDGTEPALVQSSNIDFYRMISGEILITTNGESFLKIVNYYLDYKHPKVAILAESENYTWHINAIRDELLKAGVHCFIKVASAHKTPRRVLYFIDKVDKLYKVGTVVYITISGLSNALSGLVAANTKHVVIACPPFKDNTDMLINIHSTLQMPNATPVLTILDTENAALACRRVLEHTLMQ